MIDWIKEQACWVMNQILQINIPTVIAFICGNWGAKELVGWLKNRNLQKQQGSMQRSLQKQKAEIDRQLEITKSEYQRDIQTHYLQTQLKTASLYKTYPELHWALKETEGSVYQLFYHSIGRQDATYGIWCGFTKKLAEHSLFLDDTLRDACVAAKDLLMDGIRSHDSMVKEAKDSLMDSIHKKVDVVTNLMRARLLEDRVEFPNVMNDAGVSEKEPGFLEAKDYQGV